MPQDRTLLQHTPDFRVERVVLHSRDDGWSPNYEAATLRVVLPASGATEFLVHGQSVLLDGMTALCLPSCQPYQMKACPGAQRASIVVSEQPGGAGSAGGKLPQPDAWLLTPQALWRLRRHWRTLANGSALAAGPSTHELLDELLSPSARLRPVAGRSAKAVQRAQLFMVARIASRDPGSWTLADVADAACCSMFHLARTFRRHTGLTLHGYRQRLRLALALQRLEEGEKDLAALAHELGFCNQSHLGTSFCKDLGVTPAQARRELTA